MIVQSLLFCYVLFQNLFQNGITSSRSILHNHWAYDWSTTTNITDCDIASICASSLIQKTDHTTVYDLNNKTAKRLLKPNANLRIKSILNIRKQESKCPDIEGADNLTQTQLINKLIDSCRYDRLQRPAEVYENGSLSAVKIFARSYIHLMQNLNSNVLKLKVHGLLQLRYMDPRLAFGKYAPNWYGPILGDSSMLDLIWVPHLFLSNEHDSSVLGADEKDILTSISADGTVVISSRIQATLYCWMDLKKFPFDTQHCSTLLESWMYNSSELLLHWDEESPFTFDPKMHLSEYGLAGVWCDEVIVDANKTDMRRGTFIGTYSSLNLTVHLVRKSSYYVMDYFLPSITIVAISWVSFWFQADQTSARTTLGTSTMLSFIMLTSSLDKHLPKVSYVQISEIWFLVCTIFIFSSLLEFAFVNTIWRRNQNLKLKKINGTQIVKWTLKFKCENEIVSNDKPNSLPIVASTSNYIDDELNGNETSAKAEQPEVWLTMTPEEVSLWFDSKARFIFPLAFLIFNIIFWLLVYCL